MNEFLANLNLSKEELVFSSHIKDCIILSQKKNIPKFTGFLDLRQQKIAEITANQFAPNSFCFFGGFDDAERKIFGVFPDYIYDREGEFHISVLCFMHSRELFHKDFLGSLMSLGIKREIVGDIIVGSDKSFVYIQENMCEHIIENISKIGNVGVKISICDKGEVEFSEKRFLEETVIVSSLRLDCVVAALASKSRADSSKLILSERVFVNHEAVTSCSKQVLDGDVISIRSVGKFRIGQCLSKTKKGRNVLSYKKYI